MFITESRLFVRRSVPELDGYLDVLIGNSIATTYRRRHKITTTPTNRQHTMTHPVKIVNTPKGAQLYLVPGAVRGVAWHGVELSCIVYVRYSLLLQGVPLQPDAA